MVLRKIVNIRNLGVFSKFSWDTTLPQFERFNVIYGENGTGKTTLSRLFDCLKSGNHEEYPHLEFKIESESGVLVQGNAATRKVRVFNADFVQLNIGQLDGSLKPILVVGEENKSVADLLAADQLELERRQVAIKAAVASITAHEAARGKIFSQVASTISEATIGTTQRTYRKPNAEAAFAALTAQRLLTDAELTAHRTTIKQDVMPTIDALPAIIFRRCDSDLSLGDCARVIEATATQLCARAVISDAIETLRDNPDVAKWVEEGHKLHQRHGSADCEFCGQTVPAERWKQLEAHFNKADRQLKDEIDRLMDEVGEVRRTLTSYSLPDRLALYSDFREQYDAGSSSCTQAVDKALEQLQAVERRLTEKLASRTVALELNCIVDFGELESAVSMMAAAIEAHNKKAVGFDAAKDTARAALEGHYLYGIKEEVAALDKKIQDENRVIDQHTNGNQAEGKPALVTLQAAIAEKKTQISNAHKAGEELTGLLQTFLGRSELIFHSREDGYRVLRNGKDAKLLSEGERTAIAFIYFIVQLKDQDFDLADGVVVIDDPISSLDANSVYQAFAFLKNAVKDAKQVFLLTHNFSFLRLLINWLQNDAASRKRNRFYMLLSRTDVAGRQSTIVGLDKALVEHPTEYHYLFKTLLSFKGDGTIAGCYHIPNVTRKVLETFLNFFVPGKGSLYNKLSGIEFDDNKKTAIYKFSNDLSHFTGQGFEPGLVQESQKNVTYLLEMIEALAPQHYNGMVEASS